MIAAPDLDVAISVGGGIVLTRCGKAGPEGGIDIRIGDPGEEAIGLEPSTDSHSLAQRGADILKEGAALNWAVNK